MPRHLHRSTPTLALLLPALLAAPLTGQGAAVGSAAPPAHCEPPLESALYCMELFSRAIAADAGGVVDLALAPSPFGVAVTPDGRLEYDLTAWVEGLPDPVALGEEYTTYVAWAAPLELYPVQRLGVVGNGVNDLGRVSFNKFMVMVSAEPSADVTERTGPLVLRGRSPSSRLEAHDMLAQAPAAEQGRGAAMGAFPGDHDPADHDAQAADRDAHPADRDAHPADHEPADHDPDPADHDPDAADQDAHAAGHDAHAADAPLREWTTPPMYPDIPMLSGMMTVRPRVAPLLPAPGRVDPADLPSVEPARVVELPDGGTLDLVAGYVRRQVAGKDLVMLAFNRQQPGPLLRVREAATIFVNFVNETPFPTAIHWHGLRLDNRFDGVPGVTQEAVPPGGTFRYQVHFPDPGIYWYHPHHREDVQQELGLYGNMMVDARDPDYYGPANRDEALMLDDILLDEDGFVPFGDEASTHALMGRFGNIFLVNGDPSYRLEVDSGEVVRFHLTNASNTRTFNVSIQPTGPEGASDSAVDPLPLKVVGSDVSRFEREEWARSVVLGPAERYVVEARFPTAGSYELVNRVQGINHRLGVFFTEESRLGMIRVGDDPVAEDHGATFQRLRENDDVVADIDAYRHLFDAPPDHELIMGLETEGLDRVIESAMRFDRIYAHPVEWAGTMPMMNWASTGEEVRWVLRDPATGLENMEIDWRFRVGDVVKIRVRNDRDVFHAMQHPLHFHGQRFLVLSRNGVPTENLVWKDTTVLPAGSGTDILLELSNPGQWMVHCHIAEHLEAGMKFVLEVEGS